MSLTDLFIEFPRLETERLVLRELTAADRDAIFAIFANDAVTEYYDLATFRDVDEAEQLIERVQQRFVARQAVRWGVTLQDADEVIGTVGLFIDTPERGGVGYDLAQAYWRNGIMTEALAAVLDLAFGTVGLRRVEALVMPGNVASVRLLEKLGFSDEGRDYRQAYFKGAYHDLRCFVLTAETLERRREAADRSQ